MKTTKKGRLSESPRLRRMRNKEKTDKRVNL